MIICQKSIPTSGSILRASVDCYKARTVSRLCSADETTPSAMNFYPTNSTEEKSTRKNNEKSNKVVNKLLAGGITEVKGKATNAKLRKMIYDSGLTIM